MRAAKLSKSPRLQRAFAFLSDCDWHSTRDIVHGADVCAVNDVILELEANHCRIARKREGRIWYYRMLRPNEVEEQAA